MLFNNPLSPEKFDRLLAELWLDGSSTILDVGCGQGELMAMVLRRFRCRAVGIDTDPAELGLARKKLEPFGDAVSLYDRPFKSMQFMGLQFDACFCIGASHACGRRGSTLPATIASLRELTKPGGVIVIGEPYWKQPPAAEYLAATGIEEREFMPHAACVEAGGAADLECVYTMRATPEEWDHFEGSFWLKSEGELVKDPGNPDLQGKARRRRSWKQAYLRWGRDTLGFGLFVFLVPPPQVTVPGGEEKA